MTDHELTRRDLMALTAAGTATVALPFTVTPVAATDSGEPELHTNETVPSGTTLTITVEEYETEDASSALNTQDVDVDDGENTYVLDSLDGDNSYYWELYAEFDNDGDVTTTPILDAPELAIPDDGSGSDGSGGSDVVDYTDELEWRAKPEDATIKWDRAALRKYEPALITSHETRMRYKGLYGYVYEHPDLDYDVYCYWSQLTHQDGVAFAGLVFEADSHLGDHEPIYVYVNKDTGEVDQLAYSAYHHYANVIQPEDDELVQDRADFPTHAVLKMLEPWHNYGYRPESDDWAFASSFSDLYDWSANRDEWMDNGFYEKTADAAIEAPDEIPNRETWWADGTMDYRIGRTVFSIDKYLNWSGAADSDDILD